MDRAGGAWDAVLWDVDGTIAETERDGHRVAFNQAFAEMGLPWHWTEARYGELLRITGGRERLLAEMAGRPDAPPEPRQRAALAGELHTRKNRLYAQCVARGQVLARPGVLAVMHDLAVRGVTQGIVTTTSRVNVQVLMACLLGPDWRDLFRTVLCGEDCARKKPDPQIYQLALQTLAIDPHKALAIEDAKAGVMAARGAGLWVLWRPGQYDLGAVPEDAHVRRLAAGAEFTVASLPGGPALERDGGLSGRGSFGPAL